MRKRDDDKTIFKGSVFAEMKTQEQSDKLVNGEKPLKIGETDLKVLFRYGMLPLSFWTLGLPEGVLSNHPCTVCW